MKDITFYVGGALAVMMLVLMMVANHHPNDRRWKIAEMAGICAFFGFAVVYGLVHIVYVRDWELKDLFGSVFRFLLLLPVLLLVQKKEVKENRKFNTLWRVTTVLLTVFLILLFLWAAFFK